MHSKSSGFNFRVFNFRNILHMKRENIYFRGYSIFCRIEWKNIKRVIKWLLCTSSHGTYLRSEVQYQNNREKKFDAFVRSVPICPKNGAKPPD